MKVYTRAGDGGDTALFGGQQTRKSAARVAAYGTLDEANAFVGLAAAADVAPSVRDLLEELMSDLFDLGAELATPPDESASEKLAARLDSRVSLERVQEIEAAIDAAEEGLPPLTTFVLPTGSDASARLHVARTQVRRAEREVVRFVDEHEGEVRDEVLTYLNRISDLLFVLARAESHRAGRGDVPWRARKGDS